MKSRSAYVDLHEASHWISAQLAKEGVAVTERLVAKILNRETQFLVMTGLARPGDRESVQCGYVHREPFWVAEPKVMAERDQQIQPQEENVT